MHDGSKRVTTPRISVVVIFLNAARFLREALESVRAQTFDDWELLMVDDGSSDASSEIARAFAAGEPRARYLDHPGHDNRGMSASRNRGVKEASGDWVAFLDSDDAWMPDHLFSLLTISKERQSTELVYGPGVLWHSWDGVSADRVQPVGFDVETTPEPDALAMQYLRDGNTTPCPSSVLVRRDVFWRLGAFEEAFRGMYEDQAFCFKAALGARVVVTPRSTLLYRQHPDSCCSVSFRTNEHGAARLRFLQWARTYLKTHYPAERAVQRGVRQQILDVRRSLGVLGAAMRVVRLVTPAFVRQKLRKAL